MNLSLVKSPAGTTDRSISGKSGFPSPRPREDSPNRVVITSDIESESEMSNSEASERSSLKSNESYGSNSISEVESSILESNNSQLMHGLTLEDTIKLASVEEAQKFRDEHTIRRFLNGQYSLYSVFATTTEVLGEYGAGLELYFMFLKQLGMLFAFLSFLSIWPLYENNRGNGLPTGASKQWWDFLTIANQQQYSQTDFSQALSDLSVIKQNKITISVADFVGTICFLIFFIRYFLLSNKTVALNFKNNVTAADYAVEIKGIPEKYNDPGQIKEHFGQFGEVIEVFLARKYHGILTEFRERVNLSTRLGYERIIGKRNGMKNSAVIKELEQKICKFDTEMHIRFEKGNLSHENLQVNRAYLIFNKLEDKKLCLEGCRNSKKCFKSWSIPLERLFLGEYELKVKQTTEPSNILWENLEVTRCERRLRKSVSIVLAIIILFASVTVIYLMKTYETTLPTDSYCLNTLKIDPSISIANAEAIYTTDSSKYCYCKFQSWTSIMESREMNSYCSYFITKFISSLLIKFFSACGVIFINFILKFVFKKLSKFERVSNKTKEQLNIMVKVFIATFINTALIVLIVNANFQRVSWIYYIPYTDQIFTGAFDDFTREWYTNVGESLVFTMFVCVFSPHMITLLVFYPIYICRRRCCQKSYKTQSELNKVFAGPEFDLASRNSQVLTLIFTCYLYSCAIPTLNIIAALALFILYWTDKYLVLRHYKKPPLLSYHLNSAALKFLPCLIILHSLFAMYMLGADDIFPQSITQVNGTIISEKNSLYDRIFCVTGALYCSVSFATIFVAVVLFCYKNVIGFCAKQSAKVEEETQNTQGNYRYEFDIIKKHGLHTYKIQENPDYHDLVISLDNAANNVRVLRNNLVEKKKSIFEEINKSTTQQSKEKNG